MKSLTLLAALLCAANPASALAWIMVGNGSELPAVTNCKIDPLDPQQLTAEEAVHFAKLPAGSAEATKYLYTRGYLRYAKLVTARSLDPLKLPELPARANWNRGYLTAAEARDILDVALGMNMLALMNSQAPPTC